MKEINCPICSEPLSIRIAKGRKSNKAFIMLKCDKDGRHFRGFITDQNYVHEVLSSLRGRSKGSSDNNLDKDSTRVLTKDKGDGKY